SAQGLVHAFVQKSVSTVLPSSQSSPSSTMPLPHSAGGSPSPSPSVSVPSPVDGSPVVLGGPWSCSARTSHRRCTRMFAPTRKRPPTQIARCSGSSQQGITIVQRARPTQAQRRQLYSLGVLLEPQNPLGEARTLS